MLGCGVFYPTRDMSFSGREAYQTGKHQPGFLLSLTSLLCIEAEEAVSFEPLYLKLHHLTLTCTCKFQSTIVNKNRHACPRQKPLLHLALKAQKESADQNIISLDSLWNTPGLHAVSVMEIQ